MRGTVTSRGLNVRETPGRHGTKMRNETLTKGDRLRILDSRPVGGHKWLQVQAYGSKVVGWVDADDVELDKIVAVPAPPDIPKPTLKPALVPARPVVSKRNYSPTVLIVGGIIIAGVVVLLFTL